MGTTTVRTLDSNEVKALAQQGQSMGQVGGGGAAAGKFDFFACLARRGAV